MWELDNLWACIHRTNAGLSTYFDVLPAYASPSSINNEMLWTFRLHRVDMAKRYWVLWNVVKREVTLTNSLQEYCFVRLATKKPALSIPVAFWIVLTDLDTGDGQPNGLCQLAMDASFIQKEDLIMGQVDWPHLIFSTHSKGRDNGKQVHNPHSFPARLD